MKVKTLVSKVADFFIGFAMFVCMIFIAIVSIGAVKAWIIGLSTVETFETKMFWYALLLSMAYCLYGWLVKFSNEFAKSYKNLVRKDGF